MRSRMREFLTISAGAIVSMAFAAATASAQQTVEILSEPSGGHCPAIVVPGAGGATDVDGGCLVHGESEGNVELRKHVFGIESHITSCFTESHTRVDENGQGYGFEQQFVNTGGGPPCARQACKDAGGEAEPWRAVGQERATDPENMGISTVTFCVEPTGGGTNETCEIDVPGNEFGSHTGEAGGVAELASHGFTGFRCELVGHWLNEVGAGQTHDGQEESNSEIIHLNP